MSLQITALSRIPICGTFAGMVLLGVTSCLENTLDDRNSPENPPGSAVGEHPASSADQQSRQAIEGSHRAMRVFIDPQTGQLRAPTPQEKTSPPTPSADTTKAARTQMEPKAVIRPDGTILIPLGDEHMKHKIVHVCPDGSLATRCDDTPESNPSTTPPSTSNQ